jgi:tRNA threonylcarbamoyladenosine biosynthesis protein TsaE
LIVDLPDLKAMAQFGKRIAARLAAGDVVALTGALGTGKTTLARSVIAACGHQGEVPSPTFTIIEAYSECSPRLVHADFYRLRSRLELNELGLDDYRHDAALIAEWPERVGGFAHEPACLDLTLQVRGEGRQAIVQPGTAWLERCP